MIRTIQSLLILMSVFCLSGCSNSDSKKITIATAASAQFAINELADNFSKKHSIKVDVIVGSSGKLTTQIINGAPYDIFFAANMMYPNALKDKGKTQGEPFIYAKGVPVIWSVKDGLDVSLTGLTNSNINKIVIADPKNAPYGEAAISYLKDHNLYDSLKSKLVFGESISQVNEHILNQTADIGISAKSIVMSPKLEGKGKFVVLSNKYWIDQGAVVINNDNQKVLKEEFVKYIKSEEGIKILESYGYSI